jgi:hypothetical protein
MVIPPASLLRNEPAIQVEHPDQFSVGITVVGRSIIGRRQAF